MSQSISGKRFYRFPSLVLGKVLVSPVHYWGKVVYVLKSISGKRFYRFPSLVLEKIL